MSAPWGQEHPVLAAVSRLAPRVATRSEEIEAARRLPADLAREMAAEGLFRLLLPEAYGGYEADPALMLEAFETLAYSDGSAGWCLMIGATSAVAAAWLPPEVAQAIYGSAPDVITGGVFAPLGEAVVVEGGYRVSGRWPWASGSHNCQWLMGGVRVVEGGKPRQRADGQPEGRMVFFPAEAVTLHDTWHVSGLCGTGSVDMEVKEVFVPAERSVALVAERPRVARPLYAFPLFGLLAVGVSSVALGIARRAVDELKGLAHQKRLMPSGRLLATRSSVQVDVAEAEAGLRASRAFLLEAMAQARAAAAQGDIPLRLRAELRLAATHATRCAARAVDRMYEAAGGAAVFHKSPLQRCFRDIHVATQHVMVAPPTLETAGRLLLGLEAETATL